MVVREFSAGRAGILRAGLTVLAVANGPVGGWALFSPATFFAVFPGWGVPWVAAAPPYNEHLITDFGAALLGIAVGLGLGAVVGGRRVIQVVLLAALVQALPHVIFHLSHTDTLPAGEAPLAGMALAIPVVLIVGLLWLASRQETPSARRELVTEDRSQGG